MKLEEQVPAPERYFGVSELNGRDLSVHARGDANRPRPGTVPRKPLNVLGGTWGPATSGSGRRELAEALASPNSPLTARVFVNRVWHHLFGTGIVPTVDNFGHLGEPPSRPELLDFLADRFVKVHRWSVKGLVRELVATRAYRTEGGTSGPNVWRFPLRRLDAESAWDAILMVSGGLDRTIGGPTVAVPHALAGTGSDSGANAPPSGPVDGNRRRAIYLATRRNYPSAFLGAFDRPAPQNAFGRRDVSNPPTRSLTMLNGPFVNQQARVWAKAGGQGGPAPSDRVASMFKAAFARAPSLRETEVALALVGENGSGWESLALALFNAKEFIYVP